VPVVFRGKITTSKSYYLAHTEFYPSIVTVYANKQQLDKLQTVEIEPFNYRNLQDTIRQAVKIRKIRGVKIVPSTVRLSVYPDVLTEEAIEVPITAINMPPGMVLPPAAACNTKFVMSLCYYFVELSIYLSIHSIILGIMPFIMFAYIIIYITYRNVGDVDGLSD
jgi:hypothetical protein